MPTPTLYDYETTVIMHLIVGLGNPGSEYEHTRHNVGFMVLEELARAQSKRFKAGKGEFYAARIELEGTEAVLIKPVTYMNDSGIAVAQAMEMFGGELSSLLVVYDDFNIPLGALRVRPGGSDGGHNGIGSIIYHLNTDEIPRLRCGIGTESMLQDRVDFVLSPFTSDERQALQEMIATACSAVQTFIREGTAAAMNAFNKAE